jgi:hypothetical protein
MLADHVNSKVQYYHITLNVILMHLEWISKKNRDAGLRQLLQFKLHIITLSMYSSIKLD